MTGTVPGVPAATTMALAPDRGFLARPAAPRTALRRAVAKNRGLSAGTAVTRTAPARALASDVWFDARTTPGAAVASGSCA